MITPEKLDQLQIAWVRLMAGLRIEPVAAYPGFDRLVEMYGQPSRHYHTLGHVADVLRVVSRLAPPQANFTAILLAAWFHDAVYDPQRADNEEQSAQLAGTYLRQNLASNALDANALATEVEALIRATTHPARSEAPDPATACLLDADLAILASPPARYTQYLHAVRQEYAHLDDASWREGRRAWVQRFLARPRIYWTERFYLEGEALARQNLHTECE